MATTKKILFVDDEKNILAAYMALLRKKFNVETALGPLEGLEKVRTNGPYAVVVSDLKMPKMDGITFLSKVQEIAPETVRVMLTGYANLKSAIEAVNKGAVFRFLTKPSPFEEMVSILELAVQQYELIIAERELVRETLRGCIKALTDILALVNPEAFGRSERVRRLANFLGQQLDLKQKIYLDLAAMLSHLGWVTLADSTLEKTFSGKELTEQERKAFDAHSSITAGMLSRIPRMQKVADIIFHQHDSMHDNPTMLMESRILKVCLDYDSLTKYGLSKQDAIDEMRTREGLYDTKILNILEKARTEARGYVRREVYISKLARDMILDAPLWSDDGAYLMADGTEITDAALIRISNFAKNRQMPQSIQALVPVANV